MNWRDDINDRFIGVSYFIEIKYKLESLKRTENAFFIFLKNISLHILLNTKGCMFLQSCKTLFRP